MLLHHESASATLCRPASATSWQQKVANGSVVGHFFFIIIILIVATGTQTGYFCWISLQDLWGGKKRSEPAISLLLGTYID